MPKATAPALAPTELKPSPALSILENGPESFAGRKIGVLLADGAPTAVVRALRSAAKAEGAQVELIAPTIGGAVLDDGSVEPVDQMVGGGPSVLYDAVAVVVSAEGAEELAAWPAAIDFVTDAHTHAKFVGYTPEAAALFDQVDDGYVELGGRGSARRLVERCRDLRYWERVTDAV